MCPKRDPPFWVVVVLGICVPIYRGLRLATRTYREARRASRFARLSRKAAARRLPASEPLLNTSCGRPAASRGPVTFFDLPPEIRQQIYRLVYLGPRILQPSYGCTLRDALPVCWPPGQHIRTDQDPPSVSLSHIVRLGGSGLKPNPCPPQLGCVRRGPIPDLVIGMGCTRYWRWLDRDGRETFVDCETDLMRTCRLAYGDGLHLMYGECTISLFGVDMVHYFLQNASPEGLRCIRYLHVAVILPIENWSSRRQQKTVVRAFHRLSKTLTSLRQLDVEMAFTPGARSRPIEKERIWQWLRSDVFDQFRGLEQFVLKLPVYEEVLNKTEPFPIVPGDFWDESEYSILKESVLNRLSINE